MNPLTTGDNILPLQAQILNILIVLTGIWFLRKALLSYFSNGVTVFTLVLIVFGTNYFQLITGSNPFPNNILFTLISVIIYLTIRWHDHPTWAGSILLGTALGLIIIVNPSEWVVFLIPILWNIKDRESLMVKGKLIKANLIKAVIISDPLIIAYILLALFWKDLSAFFGYIGYSQHGISYMVAFYFPQVMFSLKNGWLIYTPLIIFAISGFYFLAARKPGIYYAMFVYFLLNVIFLCSWSTYSLNDEFGRKMFIQSMAVMAFPLGFLLQYLSEKKFYLSVPFYLILSFLLILNLFQTWQYRAGILDPTGMNSGYYSAIFGQTSITNDELDKLLNREPDETGFFKDESKFNIKVIAFHDFQDTITKYKNHLEKNLNGTGRTGLRLDTSWRFSPGIHTTYRDLTKGKRIGVRMSAWVFVQDTTEKIHASMVITSGHNNDNYRYRPLNFENIQFKPHSWNKVTFQYVGPENPVPDDKLHAYIYTRGMATVVVDDIKIELFEPK